jgi:hypothetical protein
MRKIDSIRVELSERDRGVLVLLAEFGFVLHRQIWKKFWADSKNGIAAYNRLGVLVKVGLVECVTVPTVREKFYALTKEGVAVAQLKHPHALPRNRPPITMAVHQVALLDVRFMLEENGVTDWMVGEVLKNPHAGTGQDHNKRDYHVPDATYTSRKGVRVALEYDRTRRSASRIRERLWFYSKLCEFPELLGGLVYIVEPHLFEIYDKILKSQSVARPKKVLLKTVDQVLAGDL